MDPQGFYVYELVDPRDGHAFYVGKGRDDRAWQHEKDVREGRWTNIPKCERIRAVLEAGLEVSVRIVRDGLEESAAFALEMEMIVAGREGLTNIVVPRSVPKVARLAPISEERRAQLAMEQKAELSRLMAMHDAFQRQRDKPKPVDDGAGQWDSCASIVLPGPKSKADPSRCLSELALYLLIMAKRWNVQDPVVGRKFLEICAAVKNARAELNGEEGRWEVIGPGEIADEAIY